MSKPTVTARKLRAAEGRISDGFMRFGSLFTGIGGLDLAMEQLGFECAWQVEIHPYRQKVLQRHWPNVTRYEDVRTIDGNVEPVDMVVGGFPCQPFSVAGKQRGADDERNLWPETIRVIRELRPRYAFPENVPGLLSHEYFGTVLGELAEAGYDAEWGCFTAAQVGASHKRERLFILAHAEPAGLEGGTRSRADREGGASVQFTAHDNELAHTQRRAAERLRHEMERETPEDQSREAQRQRFRVDSGDGSIGMVAHTDHEGLQGRDECGNGAGERVAGTSSPQPRQQRPVAHTQTEGLSIQRSRDETALSRLTDNSFPPGPNDLDAWARVLSEVPSLEPAIGGTTPKTRRLNPQFVEWLQNFPVGWTALTPLPSVSHACITCERTAATTDRTQRLAALGDAVVPAQATMAFRALWERIA